jgi:uncharacterized protein GlcG (DUF336 family)
MRSIKRLLLALVIGSLAASSVRAQEGLFTLRSMTPETALAAARAAMEFCRQQGYQVGVAVVDRGGLLQVFLRDRLAGPHTVDIATRKAWTAASFRLSTSALAAQTQAGNVMSGLRADARVMAIGGGLPMEGGGTTLGGIGVSGAPGGEADEACARAGIRAVSDALEF